MQKEKSSERTEEKHHGICTIYNNVTDLILPIFVALVFVNFSTELGGRGDFFQVCTENMGMKVCMKINALYSFIHSLGIIQSRLTASAKPVMTAGWIVFQDRQDKYVISSL